MTEIERLKTELKSKLLEYMELKGVKRSTGQNFRCPNSNAHKHGDRAASASFWRDGPEYRFLCHGCGLGYDIFNMANVVDGLPIRGSAFVTKTIPILCKDLGIHFDDTMLDDRFKKKIAAVKVNEAIVQYMIKKTERLERYLGQRNMTLEDSKLYLIGNVNYGELYTHLRKTHSEEQIEAAGAGYGPNDARSSLAKQLFHQDRLLFGVCDEAGAPIGFAGRDMLFEEKKANKNITGNIAPKYLNTNNTKAYKKSAAMYLLDRALEYTRTNGELYIFEGYTDAITAHKHGLKNSAALGGVSFSDDHLTVMISNEVRKIILCLDSDETGQNKMLGTVEKIFKNNRAISLDLIILPPGEDDPDSMIRTKGIEAFKKLDRYSLPEYIIHNTFVANKDPLGDEDEKINNFMRWLTGYTKQPMLRRRAIQQLSDVLEKPFAEMWDQFEWIRTVEDDNIAGKADSCWSQMISDGKRMKLNDRILLLEKAQSQLFTFTKHSITGDDRDYTQQLEELEKATVNARFQMLKTGMARFDKYIQIPKGAALIGMAGYPNHGKSAFTRNLAIGIAANNPDTFIIYCSLDDPSTATIPAIIANMMSMPINNVKYPGSITIPEIREESLKKVAQGFDNMRRMALGELQWKNKMYGRVIVKDSSEVVSIVDIKRLVEVFHNKKELSGRQMVLFVDSLHSFMDVTSYGGDARANVMDTAQQLKRLATKYDMPVFSVLEMNKSERTGNRKPTLNSISETIRIEYLLDLGVVIWNDLQAKGEKGTKYSWNDGSSGRTYPYLDADIQKNKLGYFKGSILQKFNPVMNQMTELSLDEQKEIRTREQQSNGDWS